MHLICNNYGNAFCIVNMYLHAEEDQEKTPEEESFFKRENRETTGISFFPKLNYNTRCTHG